MLFFVSSSLVTVSIETWFSLRIDRAMERSSEIGEAYYDASAAKALHFGQQLAEAIRAGGLLREGYGGELERFVEAKQREYDLGVVQVFSYAEDEPLVTSVNPEAADAAFLQRKSPIVASALAIPPCITAMPSSFATSSPRLPARAGASSGGSVHDAAKS